MRKQIEVPTSLVKKGVGRRFIFVIEIKDNRGFYLNCQERTDGRGLFCGLTSYSAKYDYHWSTNNMHIVTEI